MTLSERLDRMRSEIAGCSLVSFGDLRTGMALRSSATRPFKQDFLEELLRQAAFHFEASARLCAGTEGVGAARHRLMVATPDDVRVFVRSPANSSDVVCCLCEGPETLPQITEHAIGIFRDMSGAT